MSDAAPNHIIEWFLESELLVGLKLCKKTFSFTKQKIGEKFDFFL
jgi:hypothetical protein